MWEFEYKEIWAPKNWCFWTWCWRRLLRVPGTARRSNQSILKEISSGWSLEGLMLGHLMQRVDSLEKTLMLGGIGGRRRGDSRGWDGWMASLTRWTWVWVNSRSWWWTWRPGVLQFMGSQRVGHDWVTEKNWTEETEFKNEVYFKTWVGMSVFSPRIRLTMGDQEYIYTQLLEKAGNEDASWDVAQAKWIPWYPKYLTADERWLE